MLFQAVLTLDERRALAELIGRNVHRVVTDGWAQYTLVEGGCLQVTPREIPTPDDYRPYAGVCRPEPAFIEPGTEGREKERIAGSLGVVEEIWVLKTGLTFTFPETLPDSEPVKGVLVPGGVRYGPLFHPPDRLADLTKKAPDQAVVDLDIAIEIRTARHDLLLYTDSQAYLARAAVDKKKPAGLPAKDKIARSWILPQKTA